LRSEEDDDGSWEAQLARRYYDRLYREYVLCDLSGFRRGHIGFRWRTEAEVVQGKGQFHCGHTICTAKSGLQSFEVDFKYAEAGRKKRALVKVRLCESCAYKLHYRHLRLHRRAEQRRQRNMAAQQSSRSKQSVTDGGRRPQTCRGRGPVARGAQDVHSVSDSAGSSDEPEESGSTLVGPGRAASPGNGGPLSDADRAELEALVWRGPDPQAQTREEDFDDYLREMFM